VTCLSGDVDETAQEQPRDGLSLGDQVRAKNATTIVVEGQVDAAEGVGQGEGTFDDASDGDVVDEIEIKVLCDVAGGDRGLNSRACDVVLGL
jgi:hypothetical protein